MTFLLNPGRKPNDPAVLIGISAGCFLNPLIPKTFGGLTFQKRGHLGSRMYIIYMYIYEPFVFGVHRILETRP